MPRKFIIEAIGTFFLVFTVGQCVIDPGASALAPIAIGASLMIMIYAGGHISGGHYNPAVSLAVLLRGKLGGGQFVAYVVAQLIGALLAVAATTHIKMGLPVNSSFVLYPGRAMLCEFLFTFALTFVVLNVATVKKVDGNSYYGLAIGSTVMVGAFAVGGVSGGAFNPAVAVGITMLHAPAAKLWMLLTGEIVGAIVSAGIFRTFNLGDE